MSQTIWKFMLHPERDTKMPKGAVLIHAHGQSQQICVWAVVDPDAPVVARRLMVYGTGHPCEEGGVYVGTAHIRGGSLVLHVFDFGEA